MRVCLKSSSQILPFYKLSSTNFFYFGQIKRFVLPDLGEKIKEAIVKKWHVKEGDSVEEFQEVADVATDKLFTTIPSSYKGKIHKRFHKEEDTCLVGEAFLEIELEDGAESTAQKDVPKTESNEKKVVDSTTQEQSDLKSDEKNTVLGENKFLATPAVRNMLKMHSLDARKIKGTGKDGRILKEDVLNFLNKPKEPQQATIVKDTKDKKPEKKTVVEEKATIKMSDFEKGQQKSMTESNTIPHFYLKEEFDLTELATLREKFKKDKISLTFMPFFIKAFSMAMLEYPIINSHYDVSKPFEYTQFASHNISIAIDSPKGLVVPNIKNCQNLSIIEINEELNRIRKASQEGRLGPKELFGGTVTLSNIGNICGTYTAPLILPPQICIVGIGRTQKLPRYIEDENKKLKIRPRNIAFMSLGGDHRVLNGSTAARFLLAWRNYLENPSSLIVKLK